MKREVLEGIVEITQKEFQDERGSFMESFNSKQFNNSLKKNITFVQDNLSISKKGVFRGLHFQYEFPQAKLVSVLSGEILDIVVDLRKSLKPLEIGVLLKFLVKIIINLYPGRLCSRISCAAGRHKSLL